MKGSKKMRRRCHRYDVEDVEGSFVVRIDVNVTNLSVAGMAIETQNTLIVGRRYAFSIRQNGRELDVAGRVIWCVLGKTQRGDGAVAPVFRAGIQFEEILSEKVLELQKLIESSAVLDPGTQVFGRFVANVGGSIDVEAQASFEVKKISLFGMLIDTYWSPRQDEVVPFEANLEDLVLSGRGRVAYIQSYENNQGVSRFRLGIEFAILSDKARAGLENYISAMVMANQEEAS